MVYVSSWKYRRTQIENHGTYGLFQTADKQILYIQRGQDGGKRPPLSAAGKAVSIFLEGSTDAINAEESISQYTITNDGKSDIQLVATLVDSNGTWVSETPEELVMEIINGNGIFPTGKKYVFKKNETLWDGKAAVEFRSYYSGDTVIEAYVPGTDNRYKIKYNNGKNRKCVRD